MEAVKPWRVLLRGAFLPGWSDAPQSEKDEVFREYLQIHTEWAADLGVKFIASLDNEMLIVGPPSTREANFFEVYEVPDPAVLSKVLQEITNRHLRQSVACYEPCPRKSGTHSMRTNWPS